MRARRTLERAVGLIDDDEKESGLFGEGGIERLTE
jgi:hypothetical protein